MNTWGGSDQLIVRPKSPWGLRGCSQLDTWPIAESDMHTKDVMRLLPK